MEFGGKRNSSPSGNFDSGEANLRFKKSKNSESREIKAHVSESVGDDEKLPGYPGQSIFRILVPEQLVRHLGHAFPLTALEKYENIKAQIKFIVGPRETRMVMVSAKEEPDSPLPPAVDGLLRVNRFFLDWLHDNCFPPIPEDKFATILRVPTVQASSLINSSNINSTEQVCNCRIKVFGPGLNPCRELTLYAHNDGLSVSPLREALVVVTGKSEGVHKAVESIASYLRKFLVDQSTIRTVETQYYLLEKPPHHGISLYGREASMLARSSSNQSAQFVINEDCQLRVQILRSYADAIIGIEGANITCIRRLTGATFTVEEMQEVSDHIVVVIDGSCYQVPCAQTLMLMFIAEAGGPQSTKSLYKDRMFGTSRDVRLSQLNPCLAKQTEEDGSVCGTSPQKLNSVTWYF